MSYFIFTATLVLAAARAKAQANDNQAGKDRKDNTDGERVVAAKTE